VNPQHQTLLDQVRNALRLKHYSIRIEQSYVNWIERFIRFNGNRSPQDMGRAEVQTFLTHLAIEKKRRRLHPKPGPQRPALSLPPRPRPRDRPLAGLVR